MDSLCWRPIKLRSLLAIALTLAACQNAVSAQEGIPDDEPGPIIDKPVRAIGAAGAIAGAVLPLIPRAGGRPGGVDSAIHEIALQEIGQELLEALYNQTPVDVDSIEAEVLSLNENRAQLRTTQVVITLLDLARIQGLGESH